MKASKKSGKRIAKTDLTPRKSHDVKGAATKTTADPKPAPKAIEITNYSFGVSMPTST
jgi:hypothetical protein